MQDGDALVVCDAGGGTVDLKSYEFVGNSPKTELEEIGPATGKIDHMVHWIVLTFKGGNVGSMMIDRGFEKLIESKVGSESYAELSSRDSYSLAMREFVENTKPRFSNRMVRPEFVNFPRGNFPNNPAKGIEANCIALRP
jgi:hypothetical protein